MQYSDLAAVDITPLKDELVDLVSVCLIKEPTYERPAAAVVATVAASDVVAAAAEPHPELSHEHTETHSLSELAATIGPSPSSHEDAEAGKAAAKGRTDDTITRMRRLVHYISKHDGEFVLKLAVYVRHELYIRQTANFLTALCARESNCIPFLTCYMEKIIQLPSDWLSIANFAYFFDADVAHHFHALPPSAQLSPADAKRKIPNGLRSALVHCFAKFTTFSLAKYDNQRAEKKKRRAQQKEQPQPSDGDTEKKPKPAFEQKTFTYKQLVRLLHITKPAYEVCCLLGRRYPATKEAFERMGLAAPHPGASTDDDARASQVFRPELAGTRMRLPVPETWETRLAKEGNTGKVWDRLITEGKVPFMALLRNLRNLLTHACAESTHHKVLQRLYSENEVANSKQLPYRFYSAFLAVAEAHARYEEAWALLNQILPHSQIKAKRKRQQKIKRCCEDAQYPYWQYDYNAALEAALATSVKLNVVPIRGASVVILCLSHALLSSVSTVGGGSHPRVTSQRTYLDLAALLILTLERACEQCAVIVCCGDTYEVLPPLLQRAEDREDERNGRDDNDNDEHDHHPAGLLARLAVFTRRCEQQLDSWHRNHGNTEFSGIQAYYKKNTPAVFPYAYLDQLIENEVNISSVMVVDVGHHTYAHMNKEAPSLGDLPLYLERMRRSGSEHLIFLALSVMEAEKAAPDATEGLAQMARYPARDRYLHRNDVLLSGLSDTVLRLLAERTHGGPRALIERMDELYDVNRAAVRREDYERDRRQRALDGIHLTQKAQRKKSVADVTATLGTLGDTKGMGHPSQMHHHHHHHYTQSQSSGSGSGNAGGVSGDGLTESSAQSCVPSTSSPSVKRTSAVDWMKHHSPTLQDVVKLPQGSPMPTLLSLGAEGEEVDNLWTNGIEESAAAATAAAKAEMHVEHPTSFITLAKVAPNRRLEDYGNSSSLRKRDVASVSTVSVVRTRKTHPTSEATTESNASSSPLDPGSAVGTRASQTDTTARSEMNVGTFPSIARGLVTQYRECRFFVSSTFLDMNNERNALTLNVFPHVRRWAAERGLKISLLEVDLRWGITESATAENLSTSVCLNEVSRCAPFFIGMLGARYGSCPNPLHVVAADDVALEDYAWLKDLPEDAAGQLSVTELEMRHGIYNAQRRQRAGQPHGVVFFAREQEPLKQSLPTDARGRVYDPDTPHTLERIAKLTDYIVSQHVSVIPYRATYTERSTTTDRNAKVEATDGGEEDPVEQAMLRKIRMGTLGEKETVDDGAAEEKKWLRLEDVPLLRSYVTATAGSWEQNKVLTSQDVLLDMTDFAAKAFTAITSIVAQVCGVSLEDLSQTSEQKREEVVEVDANALSSSPSASTSPPVKETFHFYNTLFDDMHGFLDSLCKLYVPPEKVVEALASFALTGCIVDNSERGKDEEEDLATKRKLLAEDGGNEDEEDDSGTPTWKVEHHPDTATATPPAQDWRLASEGKDGQMVTQLIGDEVAVAAKHSHILLLYGEDGDGKSSAMAAVAQHLFRLNSMNMSVIYYASQAGDGSLRSIVLFVALSLIWRIGLTDEFHIRESDSAESLLQVLPQIYIAAKRQQNKSIVILLDGLERSSEQEQILQHLGALVHPGVGPTIRYIISTSPASPIASALHTRVPPVHERTLPLLDYTERAQLVRLHLAHVGKRLQETMDLNELKDLLRKQDAGRPSYLTSALTYLRLFSTFDTLRDDVRYLPATIGPLFQKMFKEMEKCFDRTTVCLVLTTLYLRQPVGGIMEYNLYRLVSNVAMATRLVDLLLGTCISSRHGRLMLCNSFFEASIATTYLPYHTDRVRAWERMLAAELLYQPLARDTGRTSSQLRFVTESIQRNMQDPSSPCVFLPLRYAPRELLGVLQSAVQSNRLDVAVTLASYLPFVETLLRDASMLQPLISFLSYLHIVAKNGMWRQKLETIVLFLQNHYHILSRRPDLLTQCVLNTSTEKTILSRYSMRFVNSLSCRDATHRNKENAEKKDEDALLLPASPTANPIKSSNNNDNSSSSSSSDDNCNTSNRKSSLHTWVRWINATQQGGDTRLSLYHPSPREITCMALSPSGKLVAMGCEDGVLRVASTTTPELVCASLKHAAPVTALCFLSTRENVLVSACEQGLLYVWSVEDGTLLQVGASHLRQVSSLACHPLEPLVCTGGYDTYCLFWEVLGGTSSLHATLKSLYAQRSKNGRLPPVLGGMLSSKAASKFSTLRVTGKQTLLKPFRAERHHDYPVSAVAFHHAGEVVATACWGGKVFLLNLRDVKEEMLFTAPKVEAAERYVLPYDFRSHDVKTAVRSLCFVPSLVVTCAIACYDGSVILFDFASGAASGQVRGGYSAPLTHLAFSMDGKLMVAGDEQGSLRLSYAGVTGTELGFLNGHRRAITSVEFSPQQDDVLWSTGVDRSLQVWRIAAKETHTTPSSHSSSVTVVAVASDSSFFVTGSVDGLALVFTPNTELQQQQQRRLRRGTKDAAAEDIFTPESYVPAFTLSHDGVRLTALAIGLQNTRIVVGTVSGDIYVWASQPGLDQQKGKLIARLKASLSSSYPIVSLLCHDLYDREERGERRPRPLRAGNTRATATAKRALGSVTDSGDSSDSEEEEEEDGGAGMATQPFASALLGEVTSPTAKIESLLVTGITLNGESVKFRMYTDAVCLTLQKRRATMQEALAAEQRKQQHADEENEDDADENDDEAIDAQRGKEPTMISNNCLDIHRHKISWLKPSTRANELAQLVFPSTSAARNSASEEASSRSGPASTTVSPTTSPTFSGRSGGSGVGGSCSRAAIFGEEVLQVFPLHVQLSAASSPQEQKRRKGPRCTVATDTNSRLTQCKGMQLTEATSGPDDELDDTNYVPRFGAQHKHFAAPLRVTEHYGLIVGRTQFFLVSHRDGCARALPVYKTPSKLFHDSVFSTTLTLEEDEYFQCASRLVPLQLAKKQREKRRKIPTDRNSATPDGNVKDDSTDTKREGDPQLESFLLVIATNKGNILFIEVKHLLVDTQSSANHSEGEQPSEESSYSMTEKADVMERLQDRIVLYHSHQMFIPRYSNKQIKHDGAKRENKKYLIDSIDILLHPATTSTSSGTGMESGMFLFAGCKDGTTHVLMSHTATPDASSAIKKTDSPSGQEPNGFEGVLSQHHYFTEVAIFFASSALTAQAVFPLPSSAAPLSRLYAAKQAPWRDVWRGTTRAEAQEATPTPTAVMSTISLLSRVRWVVGDRLGNIYQLALADEVVHMRSERGEEEQRTQRHHLSALHQQTPLQYNEACLFGSLGVDGKMSSALGRSLMEKTRKEEKEEGRCQGQVAGMLQGWAWNSRSTMDWLKRVQIDALLPQPQKVQSTANHTSPASVEQKTVTRTGTPAHGGRHTTTTTTTTTTAGASRDEWKRMLCEVAPQSTLLYSDENTVMDSMSALRSHHSFLPTPTKNDPPVNESELVQDVARHACTTLPTTAEAEGAVPGVPFPTSSWDLWSDREMAKWMAEGRHNHSNDDGGEAPSHVEEVREDILPPLPFDGPVVTLPSFAQDARPHHQAPTRAETSEPKTAHTDVQTPPAVGNHEKANVASESILTVLASPTASNSSNHPPAVSAAFKDSSKNYFSILTLAQPPASLGAQEKKAWLQQKQSVLKEALRVQGYNEDARAALEIFRNQTVQCMQFVNI